MKVKLVKIFGILIFCGLLGISYYFYHQYRLVSGKAGDEEVKKLMMSIEKVMLLPDEVPTLATITDSTKLANQKFFRNAENGDKVLIFSLASKAILYRPSQKKIIEVASVTTNNDLQKSPAPSTAKEVSSKTGVEIYNGTNSVGLTTKYEKILTEQFKEVVVLGRENAKSRGVTQTVVIDITGKSSDLVKKMAESLKAKIVDKMPEGETVPTADVLIILGQNSVL